MHLLVQLIRLKECKLWRLPLNGPQNPKAVFKLKAKPHNSRFSGLILDNAKIVVLMDVANKFLKMDVADIVSV